MHANSNFAKAWKVFKTLKHRFHEDVSWSRTLLGDKDDDRTTHGLSLLLTDLSSNNVGFEGLGFFTVSYSLIGSVRGSVVSFIGTLKVQV